MDRINARASSSYTHTPQGKTSSVPKQERYKWNQDIGEQGSLEYIKKELIYIPEEYQRNLNNAKTTTIASDFRWDAFGAITVVRRNGKLYVIEGQHRLAAALKRSDVSSVPCVVFDSSGLSEEASAFLLQNTNRKPLTFYDRFKALEVSEDETAKFVRELVDTTGHELASPFANSRAKKLVRCTAAVYRLARTQPNALLEVWPVVSMVFDDRPVSDFLLEGLCYIENMLPGTMANKRWRKRIVDAGYEELTRSVNSARAFFSKGGPRVYATGIVKAINKGLPERSRLVLRTQDESI